jgi:biotin transporter BioY
MHLNVAMMTRTALMAAVTAVAAQIAIPLPFSPVPFTLQVLAVILSGLLLGSRYGALAQAIYVLVGRSVFPSSPSSPAGSASSSARREATSSRTHWPPQ